MEEVYAINVAKGVDREDLLRMNSSDRERVLIAVGAKLSTKPDLFGKPLRRPLAGYWDLRVGNYRVIYRIGGRAVYILVIMHRKAGYNRKLQKLLKRRES
jgi:mRNA interferase RelE/StbE